MIETPIDQIERERLPELTAAVKTAIRARAPRLRQIFEDLESALEKDVKEVERTSSRNESPIPILSYPEIAESAVTEDQVNEIRKRGCVIVRETLPRGQVDQWNEDLARYITGNGYYEQLREKATRDEYFSNLDASKPQIFGIYWSKAQVEARQSRELAETRRFLNSLWQAASQGSVHFDPRLNYTYADRIRRREPGDETLGLSPHVDAGSVERWLDPDYRQVYRHIFSGDWTNFDPYDGAFRVQAREIPSPTVCSMFRTFQGWLALTEQGPGDGTLQLVPILRSIAYVLLRPLLDDVEDSDLCGAAAGRALAITEKWHGLLLRALTTIPRVYPGDTVWWHPDIIHAVEDKNTGSRYASVIYIGAAPACAKNAAYLPGQREAFLKGESAPDFPPEHFEVDYQNRAVLEDLTPLGRRQMGFQVS